MGIDSLFPEEALQQFSCWVHKNKGEKQQSVMDVFRC